MGFKLMAGAVASCALIGVAVGVGIIVDAWGGPEGSTLQKLIVG